MIRTHCVLTLAVLIASTALSAEPKFELEDGDRVVFLGNALLERSLPTAYLEAMLTQAFPAADVTFRNLAWSGDNVFGHARVGFDAPNVGFRRIEERLKEVQPSVVVLGYGMNASFEGEKGLERFVGGYKALLGLVDSLKARVVHLSPIRHENLGAPLPDPKQHNQQLEAYVEAIEKIATERQEVFVDLYRGLGDGTARSPSTPYTDNGIHLTDYGYWSLARVVGDRLGVLPPAWSVDVDAAKGSVVTKGTRVSVVESTASRVTLEVSDLGLPLSPPPGKPKDGATAHERVLRVKGLAAGRYVVEARGEEVARASAEDLAEGLVLVGGPEHRQVERLRGTIARKNFLFFHQWRPQNNTYLFLFRKHEQGHLAAEVKDFVPLIETQEKNIADLRKPKTRKYVVRREDAREGAKK